MWQKQAAEFMIDGRAPVRSVPLPPHLKAQSGQDEAQPQSFHPDVYAVPLCDTGCTAQVPEPLNCIPSVAYAVHLSACT